MKGSAWIAVLVASIIGGAVPADGQYSDELLRALQKDIEVLKEGQGKLQRDLEEIRTLLRSRAAPAPAPDDQPQNLVLRIDDAAAKGDRSARLVLVDFTDYQ